MSYSFLHFEMHTLFLASEHFQIITFQPTRPAAEQEAAQALIQFHSQQESANHQSVRLHS